ERALAGADDGHAAVAEPPKNKVLGGVRDELAVEPLEQRRTPGEGGDAGRDDDPTRLDLRPVLEREPEGAVAPADERHTSAIDLDPRLGGEPVAVGDEVSERDR